MSIIADRIKQSTFETDGQEAIISILVTASYLKEKLNFLCEKEAISLQQFNILRILKGIHPDGYARCDISNRMVEKAPDTTRLIDRLVKTKLVIREQCKEDKRRSISKITEMGLSVLNKVNNDIHIYNTDLETKLSKEKCKQMAKNCNDILRF